MSSPPGKPRQGKRGQKQSSPPTDIDADASVNLDSNGGQTEEEHEPRLAGIETDEHDAVNVEGNDVAPAVEQLVEVGSNVVQESASPRREKVPAPAQLTADTPVTPARSPGTSVNQTTTPPQSSAATPGDVSTSENKPLPSPSSTEKAASSARLRDLYEEAERRKEKLRQLETQLPSDYTFSPSINKMRGKDSISPEKRAEKLYEDAKVLDEKRRQAAEEAKRKVDPEATFKPEISARAAKKTTPGGPGARSEKLYADAIAMQEKREAMRQEAEKRMNAELTFKPTIQPLRIRPGEPRPPSPRQPPVRSPSPQPGPVPAVVSRLLLAEQKKAETLARLEKEKLERERSQYTFTPQLPVRSGSPRPRGASGGSAASVDVTAMEDKWSRLSRAGAKDFAALDLERERLATRDCTFKPVVHATPPTSALVITAEKVDVHSRLYGQANKGRSTTPNQQQQQRRGPSPLLGRPIFASSRASPKLPPPLASSAAAPMTPNSHHQQQQPHPARGHSPLPLHASAPHALARPQPAFGSSSGSRILDPKESGVVVPISGRDSSAVAPMDPHESELISPESPAARRPSASLNSSPEKSMVSPATSPSRRPLSPVINARPPSPSALPATTRAAPRQAAAPVSASPVKPAGLVAASTASPSGSAFRRSGAVPSSTTAAAPVRGRSMSPKPAAQRAPSPKPSTPSPPASRYSADKAPSPRGSVAPPKSGSTPSPAKGTAVIASPDQ